MNEPDGFLTRWSRRKRDVAESKSDSAPDPAGAKQVPAADGEAERVKREGGGKQAAPTAAIDPKPAMAETPFDPKSLPPIESIGPESDIKAFLAPGVPAALTRAAMRRAWAADPAIRDFIGLVDYDFDFTTPGALPEGFGALDSTVDVKQMLKEIFGKSSSEQAEAEASRPAGLRSDAQAPADISQREVATDTTSHRNVNEKDADRSPTQAKSVPDQMAIAQHNKTDAASQHETEETEDGTEKQETFTSRTKRSHGGALPE